ncbi:MAG: lipopolysaccharide biosynthesis protein [Peptococcaceae bacterium BRH_c4a]|nr:MAG: lipopolysaccharide biosynthesis protein [Peptococcaceae bacterium BRH_c4a]
MEQPDKAPDTMEEVIDLKQYINVLLKRKKIIALVTLLSVFTSAVLSFFILPPIYEAKALLLVTQASDKLNINRNNDNLDSLISSVSRIPQLTMNTYVDQLKSEVLMQRVIDRLGLDKDIYTPSLLLSITEARALKDSTIIELKVTEKDAALASKIANTISEQYLELISEKNQEQMSRSVVFLSRQADATQKELKQLLDKLKAFDTESGGISLQELQFQAKSQDLAKYQSQLNDAQVELSQAEAGRERLERELAATPKTISVMKAVDGSKAPVASEEVNPLYIAMSQELNQKTGKAAEARARITAIVGIVSELKDDIDKIQSLLVPRKSEREQMEAEKKRLENASNLLAEKTTQTQIAKSIDLGGTAIVMVSPAMVPGGPVKPNKKMNIALAFILGLMVSVFLAFLMEHLDNTLKNANDVASKLNVPVLGIIPRVDRIKE